MGWRRGVRPCHAGTAMKPRCAAPVARCSRSTPVRTRRMTSTCSRTARRIGWEAGGQRVRMVRRSRTGARRPGRRPRRPPPRGASTIIRSACAPHTAHARASRPHDSADDPYYDALHAYGTAHLARQPKKPGAPRITRCEFDGERLSVDWAGEENGPWTLEYAPTWWSVSSKLDTVSVQRWRRARWALLRDHKSLFSQYRVLVGSITVVSSGFSPPRRYNDLSAGCTNYHGCRQPSRFTAPVSSEWALGLAWHCKTMIS